MDTPQEITKIVDEVVEEVVPYAPQLMGLKKKIISIKKELPGIPKDDIKFWSKSGKEVKFPAYKSDRILHTIRPILAEHGVGVWLDEDEIYSSYGFTLIQYIFTLWDMDSGEERSFKITNPLSSDMKDSQGFQASDTFVIKRFWRRLLMIADPQEDEELDLARAADRQQNAAQEAGEIRVATIYSIIPNPKYEGNRPKWLGVGKDDESNDIRVSLWDNSISFIAAMLGRAASALIENMPISFTEPLFLAAESNQYGWRMSSNTDDQIVSLRNPAIAFTFMQISKATKADALQALNVENDISAFEGDIQDALHMWNIFTPAPGPAAPSPVASSTQPERV